MSSTSPRLSRRAAILIATAALVVPSLPVVAAVIDPDVPMVARATTGARRTPSVQVASTVSPPVSDAAVLAAEVVRLTNVERGAAGLPALATHPAVTLAAVLHSQDQAAMGTMSHTGSDGSDGGTRLTRAGFTWGAWGENVARGQLTARDVVTAWMGSSAHRSNMMSSTFTTVGVGTAVDAAGNRYWTMTVAA